MMADLLVAAESALQQTPQSLSILAQQAAKKKSNTAMNTKGAHAKKSTDAGTVGDNFGAQHAQTSEHQGGWKVIK
eukprot:9170120-Karenia_brevis.AAC.1